MVTSTCTKEKLIVETEKGRYTIPTEDWAEGFCAAQNRCTMLGGAILAPIKERSEFNAVMKSIKSCEHQNKVSVRYIGLHIASDNSTRVFTDGVKFDYEVHGHLYKENYVNMPQNCPAAILAPELEDNLHIGSNWNCGDSERLFICFEPKKTIKFDAITSVAEGGKTSVFIAVGSFLFVAVACMFGYLVRQIKNLKIKLQQTSTDV